MRTNFNEYIDKHDSLKALARAVFFMVLYLFTIGAASLPVGIGFFLYAKEIQNESLGEIPLYMEDVILILSSLAAIVILIVMIVFCWLALRYLDKQGSFREIGSVLTKKTIRDFFRSLAATSAIVVVIFLVSKSMGLFSISEFAWQLKSSKDLVVDIMGYALLLGSVVIAEELVFRGYIRYTLTGALNPHRALIVSAVIFALYTVFAPYTTVLAVLNSFLMGIILGALFLKSGSLWVPIAAHFAWSFVGGIIFSLPIAGIPVEGLIVTHKVSWLVMGSKFGPEGSVVGFIALLVAGLFIWLLGLKRS